MKVTEEPGTDAAPTARLIPPKRRPSHQVHGNGANSRPGRAVGSSSRPGAYAWHGRGYPVTGFGRGGNSSKYTAPKVLPHLCGGRGTPTAQCNVSFVFAPFSTTECRIPL